MKQILDTLNQKLNRLEGQYKAHKKQFDTTKSQIEALQAELQDAEKALVIAQEVAKQTQQELEFRISDIVTASLASIFDDPYEFKVKFDIKRNKTEANLIFLLDGHEVDPLTASGGGVVEIAAFALRIACYLISHPRPMPVLILDEPFKCVSEEYRPKLAELVQTLSHKLGIQVILVTHITEYEMGKIISFN